LPRRLTPALALLIAGCSNPLARHESDLGRQVPVERLRAIQPLHLDHLAKPPPPEGAPEPDPAVAARSRFAGMAEAPLTIEEARASALEHNLDLKVALIDPTIARQNVDIEESRFEAAFTTRALWQETDSPTASSLTSAQQKFQQIEPGVRIPLRTGGTATIGLPFTRNETNNAFSFLNPSYTSDLDFSISHPLLRDAGREVNTTALRVANYNRQITEAQTKLAIINQLQAVDRAYWRLYQARRDLEVRQQQYELAAAQLDKAERIVRAGRQAEIEVIRAQAGLAQRLDAIITAQNVLLQTQRELKRIINDPGLRLDGKTLVIPRTEPRPVEYLVDPAPLTAAAIDNRMEMLELELRLLADAANIRFAQNQTLPALDLTASYSIQGLGGSSQDSFHTLEKNKFESWSIGATLDVPLGNEGARARLRQAILTRLQRLSTREARKLLIRQDVADAVDRIEAGWERILATRQSTILSTRELQAEQRQFDVGAATSTDVLDAAARLAVAQLTEIQAITDYQIAQIDLAAATGTLLGAAHIQWDPAPNPAANVTPDMLDLPADATMSTTGPTEVTPPAPSGTP
jgi:outer membrane protein TolC